MVIVIPENVKEKIPEGIQKRDVKLFSIAGFFSDKYNPDLNCVAFGGYFRYDLADKVVCDGQLADAFGLSSIEGRMTDEILEFNKKYSGRRDIIHYEFKKQGEIWVGQYYWRVRDNPDLLNNENGDDIGKQAQCLTLPVIDDAFIVTCGAPRDRDLPF
jgi:hypothetical protein